MLPPAVLAAITAGAGPAAAHAFGQRYDLPVPFELYLMGAAAAVAVSFVVIGIFLRGTPWSGAYPRLDLLGFGVGRLLAHRAVIFILQLVSVTLLGLVVLTGLVGNQTAQQNLAPLLVWIIWWVGLAYVSAFAGNLWALLNPWSALFRWADVLSRRVRPGRELSLRLAYPEGLGVWPALALLMGFSWLELIFSEPAVPANVAIMTLAYSAVTWAGMFLFGRERWLRHGEAFSLLFGILARFSPTEVRVSRPEACDACSLAWTDRDGTCIDGYGCFRQAPALRREWALRPFAVGLLRDQPVSNSMMAFVLFMLSMVLFDGALATPQWVRLEEFLAALGGGGGEGTVLIIRTFGLFGFWGLFLGAYLVTCALMRALTHARRPVLEMARTFTFSLVPIAIAYHLAHYLTFILIQGQYIVPLASDPFGFGWDILGTADYRVDITVVGARFAWYAAVISIVVGHIVAVYLAHVLALDSFGERRLALRSQVPMTVLMVLFTVTSLTILAEPIVESGAPLQPAAAQGAAPVAVAVPADAVRPEPGSGLPHAVGGGKSARVRLTYKSLSSAFHDGTVTAFEDILYPYSFAFRWGVRSADDAAAYDPYVDKSTALMRARLVGLKRAGIDKTSKSFRMGELNFRREMPITEVYIDAAHENLEDAAVIAPPWSTLPWHVVALMEEAVTRGWAAFSEAEAKRRGVEWLDIVRSEPMKKRLAGLVAEFEREGFVPAALKGAVSPEEARKRWSALRIFHGERGHFLATNGPYIIREWSDAATVLDVFRDFSYPLGVGSYDSYAMPRHAYVAKVEPHEEGLRVFAEFERMQKAMRSFRLLREPLRSNKPQGLGMRIPECRFVVVSAEGAVVLAGQGKLRDDGTFILGLKGKLEPGAYTVLATLVMSGNTMNAEIKRIPYTVSGGS